MVIIIILKSDSGVNMGQGKSHQLGGWPNFFFLRDSKWSHFDQKK
jgi:hypothetical protein